jgi:acetoin utilization deacetylase AcuC-like enzyme
MTTFYYSNPICLEHLVPAGHPERPDRMKALEAVFEHEHFNTLVRHLAPEAAAETVLLAHPESYLAKIRAAIPETGFSRIDSDTTASPRSMEAALISVGGAMAAVDAVFRKEADNAFVATRPPGHHAEKNTSMGFCLFNQAAIAARHAQKAYGAERVAIIDWDVHHGNGTQDIFYDDPRVIYCSTHQMPLYPGTGALRETGKHGNIFNAPLSRQ